MSLILDALSRAERDKRAPEKGVPDLLAQPDAITATSHGVSPWWLLAAALLFAGVLLLVFWPATDVGIEPDSASYEESALPLPALNTVPERGPVPAVAVKPALGPGSSASAPAPAKHAPRDQAAIAALYARGQVVTQAVDETTPAAVAAAVAATGAAPIGASQGSATVLEQPIDIDAVLREVRRAAGDARVEPHPVPLLAALSKQFRDSVPTLMYLRHDYNARAGKSTVLINGQTLRAGQRSRAVELVEILPDSVVLRFAGTDFRLRALNSWVNL
ncbi:MAG: general secretion pathway protein B [Halieaceae bacterium]|jgi:general secretion pathway protein B